MMASKKLRTLQKTASGTSLSLEAELQRALRNYATLEADLSRVREHLNEVSDQLVVARRRVDWMEHTRSWKLTRPLRAGTELVRRAREALNNAPAKARDLFRQRINSNTHSQPSADNTYQTELTEILTRYKGRPIIVAPPLIDWDVPLFQRPQQLALSLAASGYLYFYCTQNAVFDHYRGFVERAPGCFVTDQLHLVDVLEGKTVHLYSTARNLTLEEVKARQVRGDQILYDYIDELHPDISGHSIPRATFQLHYTLLADESVACIATADKLINDVRTVRKRNCALITNGVDTEHFSRPLSDFRLPDKMERLAKGDRVVIGYYGALAKWFDYDLVRMLARTRPQYEILLIGENYDGSLQNAGLSQFENITVLGPVPYSQLPHYARVFDVSIIPFVVNDITRATSPLKLFEYMTIGAPIVTTDLTECRKYMSCLVARDAAHFVEQIDSALLRADDPMYRRTLETEAKANSWPAKAKQIHQLLTETFG